MAGSRPDPDSRTPRIQSSDDGTVEVAGDLTFDTVGRFVSQSAGAFRDRETTTLDLAKVVRTDSAGLALLVEWLRQARRRNSRVIIINMPEQMRSIARMSKLDGVLLSERA